MIRKLLFYLILSHFAIAQTDFQNLKWEFRGPQNIDLRSKEIYDISDDPKASNKLWVCTMSDGLFYNENIFDSKSLWQKASLPISRIKKICFSPTNPQIMLAISDFRLWRSNDAGKNWSEILKQQPSELGFGYRAVWISKKGRIVVASDKEIFVSEDDGKSFRTIYESKDKFHSTYDVFKVWVQENERLYLQLNNFSLLGMYSDDYRTWNEISLEQMKTEEVPQFGFDQFHGYIISDGTQLHGFTTNRKNIIDVSRKRYSTDGGSTYATIPDSWYVSNSLTEFSFINNSLIYTNGEDIYRLNNRQTEKINFGALSGEFKEFAIRNNAGDNYFLCNTSKFVFNINDYGVSEGIRFSGSLNSNYTLPFLISASQQQLTSHLYKSHSKYIELSPKTSIILKNNRGLAAAYTYGEYGYETNYSDITPENIFISDFAINKTANKVFALAEDGNLFSVDLNEKLKISKIFTFNSSFYEAQIECLDEKSQTYLLTDKKKNLWLSKDEGKSWQNINLDRLNNLKTNVFKYLSNHKIIALGTDAGLFFIKDFDNATPTLIKSEMLGNEVVIDMQFREADEYLAILTRKTGIYTTNILSKPNQLITQSLSYFNIPGFSKTYTDPLKPIVCDNQKIRVHFTTNIPKNDQIKYKVEVSDKEGNFINPPYYLDETSTQSPIEVTFRSRNTTLNSGNYKLRVVATGTMNVIGTESNTFTEVKMSRFDFTSKSPTIGYSYAQSSCIVDSFKLFTVEQPKYRYEWLRDNTPIEGANQSQIYVKDKSKFGVNWVHDNGWVIGQSFISLPTCANATNNKAILINIPQISAAKTTYFSTEKAILKVDGCENINYQWLKDGLPIKDATSSTYEVKESGNYKLKIEKFGCENHSKELPIQIINVLANEELDNLLEINVFPNPSADKISIHSKEFFMKTTEIFLHDLNGKELKRLNFTNFTSTEIDLQDFQQGSYLLSVVSNNKKIIKKIIVQ